MKKRSLIFPALIIFGLLFSCSSNEKKDCPFCSKKVIDYQKYYEDETCLGLYSYKPLQEGHCLIIPKRHVQRFEDLSQDEMVAIYDLIKKTNSAVREVFDTNTYIIIQKNGTNVGQTVDHVHFHYIPRNKADKSTTAFILRFLTYPLKRKIKPNDMKALTENISQKIRSIPINSQ